LLKQGQVALIHQFHGFNIEGFYGMSRVSAHLKQKLVIVMVGVALLLICLGIYINNAQARNNNTALANWTNDNLVVLLTMTIDTGKGAAVARNKIPDRISDYRKSLVRWAALPYKVVVVENSGYGNPFQDILEKSPHITYVSTHIPSMPVLGIGYGEAQTLKYAMERLIKDNSVYIMKITGRYAPKENLSEVVNILMSKKPEVLLKVLPNDLILPKRSEWFVAKRPFYQEISEDCIHTCDERKGTEGLFEAHLHHLGDTKKGVIKTTLRIDIVKTRTGSFNAPVSWI